MRVPSGATDRQLYFVAVDATDLKTRETGLSSFTVVRSRNGAADATYTTPTVVEIDNATMPGVYALLIDEDTTITSGKDEEEVCVHITHAGMAPVTRTFELYRPKLTEGQTVAASSSKIDGVILADTVTTLTNLPAITAGWLTATGIAAGAITNAKFAAGAIDDAAIADGAIDAATFAAGAITATVIANGAIDAATFAADVDAEILSYLVDDATRIDASALNTASGNVPTILGQTGTTGVVVAAASKTGYTLSTAGLAALFTSDSGTTYASAVAGSVVKEIADNAGGSALTVAGIADGVWDEILSGHVGAGSTGEALGAAGAAGDPWITALPGAYGAGSAGKIIGDNINATISSRASQTSVDTVDNVVDAILVDTDNTIPGLINALAAFVDTEVAAILLQTGTNGVVVNSFTTAAKALLEIEANDALVANGLDSLATTQDVVDGVYNEATAGHVSAGTFGLLFAALLSLLDDARAEPGQGAPPVNPDAMTKLDYLYKAFRNRKAQTATQYSLYADDATTVDQKSVVSHDGTTVVVGEMATGP